MVLDEKLSKAIKDLPFLEQSQNSLTEQLLILRLAANKLGLYDAADFLDLERNLERNNERNSGMSKDTN